MQCIYVIENIENGKKYVGSTTDEAVRFRRHRTHLRRGVHFNPLLQSSWNFYGESCFNFYVVEEVSNSEDLLKREQEWIDYFDSKGHVLFNVCKVAGSRLGSTQSDETRARISESGKGRVVTEETKSRMSVGQTGRKHTDETKRKISESAKERYKDKTKHPRYGAHWSEETRKKFMKPVGD